MRRDENNNWVTDEPDVDKAEAWNQFWKTMAGELARTTRERHERECGGCS